MDMSLCPIYNRPPQDYDPSSFLGGCLGALEREKEQEKLAGLTNKSKTNRRD